MTTVRTQISENLIKDLIVEFLSKTGLESSEISDLKLLPHTNAGQYNLTYNIKEEEVSSTNVN